MEIVQPGDINNLAKKTMELLEDDARREEIQKKALNYVKQNYDSGKPITDLISIYNSITNNLN